MRWNTRFYGTELRSMPPVESKQAGVRYFHEYDEFDAELRSSWIRQAAKLPGADCF